MSYGEHTLGEGTYDFALVEGGPRVVFDVPAGLRLEIVGLVVSDSEAGETTIGLILRDTSGGSWICVDVERSEECNRRIVTGSQAGAVAGSASTRDVGALFDRISESLWLETGP